MRAYGVWTGTSKSTGRTFTLPSYHNFDFADGKIIYTGEYFDATGMTSSVGPVDRKVVVATMKVKEGNYEKVKELLDAETGLQQRELTMVVLILKQHYNEENNTYFIIEYWESFEKYNAYLDWRLNDDPSGAADEIFKYLVGGRNGLVTNTNNIGYKFY